jgi:hypothetical protein
VLPSHQKKSVLQSRLVTTLYSRYSMALQRYENRHRDSGVTAYEIGDDYIKVEFADGPLYLYTHDVPGPRKVERMKRLARQGRGLSTYISRNVRDRYASRLR